MTRYSTQLVSTALASAEYDDETSELEITFTSGAAYTYQGVPLSVFEALRDARSPGSFYHQNIKGVYT